MLLRSKYDLIKKRRIIGIPLLLMLSYTSLNGYAGPGKLSNAPLYVGAGVKPNVLYVMDDSGSMDWALLKSRSAEMAYPFFVPPDFWVNSQYYYRNSWVAQLNMFEVDDPSDPAKISPKTKLDALHLCSGYNVLAFNPNYKYEPWYGYEDIAIDLGAALRDPVEEANASVGIRTDYYLRVQGGEIVGNSVFQNAMLGVNVNYEKIVPNVIDLSNAVYMPWDDLNNNHKFDPGECHEDIGAQPGAVLSDTVKNHLVYLSNATLPAGLPSDMTLENFQQNFANWYTYYRTRNYAMVAALTQVLGETEQRVGLATINNSRSVAKGVVDIAEDDNRNVLLQTAAAIRSQDRGTPLDVAMENAGRYFDQTETPVVSDGAFVIPDTSPLLDESDGGACQQNHLIMMTDGYANTYQNNARTLSVIAEDYYDRDLSIANPNEVASRNPLDSENRQHMVTHAVAFGVEGNFDPNQVVSAADEEFPNPQEPEDIEEKQNILENGIYQGSTTWWEQKQIRPFNSDTTFADWPNPIRAKSADTIDDLFHATVMGRGRFFNSAAPDQLVSDLKTIENSIASGSGGSASAPGFNTTRSQEGTLLFQTIFDPMRWTGELKAYRYEDGVAPDQSDLVWEAGEILAQRVDPENTNITERNIITFNGDRGVPFRSPSTAGEYAASPAGLSEAQLRDLLATGPEAYGSADAALRERNKAYLDDIIDFLRGGVPSRTEEHGKNFRLRGDGEVLGDIVYSSPVMVGKHNEPYNDLIEPDYPYSEFVITEGESTQRPPVVYVGANDGMLHAFDADTGEELFAYIPGLVYSSEADHGLHHLASDYYLNRHLPYVDGKVTPADVYIDGWKTYLAGSLGAGGKGIFVLDITHPENISESNSGNLEILEFTNENLGYTFARPQIVKLNSGDWAVVVGNGYNNNGSYEASLFIFYLDGHEGEGSAGDAYREISTGVGSESDCNLMLNECNGLSSPSTLDITGDSITDRVYAGDIQGNMWVFDLSSDDPEEWGIAHTNSQGAPTPLFRACRAAISDSEVCQAEDRQPITVRPVVIPHPRKRGFSTDPNLLVFFGTGQYLAEGDTGSPPETYSGREQSVYAVWDAGAEHGNLVPSDLVEQNIVQNTDGTGDELGTRLINANSVNYALSSSIATQGVYGWSAALPVSKERLVVDPIGAGNLVVFESTIPSNAACEGGGSGYLMVLDMVYGAQPRFNPFPSRDDRVAGFVLNAAPGGGQIIDNDIVIVDYRGQIHSEDFLAAQPRPSRRAAWSILK